MNTTELQRATLRAALPFSSIEVDAEAGVIRNASVMTVGPALGHGFELDQTSLKQLADAINASGGSVKVRFKHPTDITADDLGSDVGLVKNVRVEGEQVRGDIYLKSYAKNLPSIGNVWDYLIAKAVEAPHTFGLSAVIDYELEPVNSGGGVRVFARIRGAEAVDFVGQPAANPAGLLSKTKGKTTMDFHPSFKPKLSAKFGLSADATDEAAQAFFSSLSAEARLAVASDDEEKDKPEDGKPAPTEPEDKPAASMSAKPKAEGDIVALQAKKVREITALAATIPTIGQEQINDAIARDLDLNAARKAFLSHLEQNAKPIASIRVGEDRKVVSLEKAIPDAIRIRAGLSVANAHEMSHKLASLTMLEQFRHYLLGHGVRDAQFFGQTQLAELFTSRRKRASLAQSTSDFDNLLMDASNKTLRSAYVEIKTSWSLWARRSTNPDFKAGNRIQMSEVGLPVERREGGEITYNTLSDGKEQVTLTEYATGIKLTRRAVINDDMDAFNRIPMQLGAAFARLEDRIAYGILTANATLATTGGALFNSTALTSAAGHANIETAAVISVASLAATSAWMRKQVGMKKVTGDQAFAYLDLRPKTLIVPVAYEVTAAQLIGSGVDPTKSNATPNPYFNSLQVVSHPILDVNSATKWYLAADPSQIDTVEVCFLQDEQAPVIKNETEFDTDDIKFAGRHTIGAKAIDYRGLVRNGA